MIKQFLINIRERGNGAGGRAGGRASGEGLAQERAGGRAEGGYQTNIRRWRRPAGRGEWEEEEGGGKKQTNKGRETSQEEGVRQGKGGSGGLGRGGEGQGGAEAECREGSEVGDLVQKMGKMEGYK